MAKSKVVLSGGDEVTINNKKKRFTPSESRTKKRPHYFDGGTVSGVPLPAGYYPDPITIWAAFLIGSSLGDGTPEPPASTPSVDSIPAQSDSPNVDPTPDPTPTPEPSYSSDSSSSTSDYSAPSYDAPSPSYDSGSSSFDSGGSSFDSGSSSF